RLVLCFDGTDNKFEATEQDSNIVKLYEMLNRTTSDQFHYYQRNSQAGIGTYRPGQLDNTEAKGIFAETRDKIHSTLDEMFGTSFVHHVIGGYQFILKYYMPGDKIYIFGFSRGAYTARFLSEMIDNIGLLSMGNEELIQFAWETFSDFQRLGGTTKQEAYEYMQIFKSTFCRPGVRVYFLGLFDCVNSVATFSSTRDMTPYILHAPARHIRHAVSIHERRAMFRPSLFLLNNAERGGPDRPVNTLKEVWFAGNHGDVGGGWPLAKVKNVGETKYLLSDVALKWMVAEVRIIEETKAVSVWM
ncbi:hypothetical protein NA57DRAFT_7423, partial [Rhizodiscina lignyota]